MKKKVIKCLRCDIAWRLFYCLSLYLFIYLFLLDNFSRKILRICVISRTCPGSWLLTFDLQTKGIIGNIGMWMCRFAEKKNRWTRDWPWPFTLTPYTSWARFSCTYIATYRYLLIIVFVSGICNVCLLIVDVYVSRSLWESNRIPSKW